VAAAGRTMLLPRALFVAIVGSLQIATVGGGLAQWSTEQLSAWVANELQLPDVAAKVARAGIDGDRAQSMEKGEWRAVGATGLQAAKLRARVVKAAQDDSDPPSVAAGHQPTASGQKFAVGEFVDVETEDGVERGVKILGAAASGSPDELRCRPQAALLLPVSLLPLPPPPPPPPPPHVRARMRLSYMWLPDSCLAWLLRSVEFADGTVDDWSVDDMTPVVKSQKSKRAKGASRRQQKRRMLSMSVSELFEAGVKAFGEQQYEDALGLFEHAQQAMDPTSDPQTTLNVYNFHGVRLWIVSISSTAVIAFLP
jgi:hypothetical protein